EAGQGMTRCAVNDGACECRLPRVRICVARCAGSKGRLIDPAWIPDVTAGALYRGVPPPKRIARAIVGERAVVDRREARRRVAARARALESAVVRIRVTRHAI